MGDVLTKELVRAARNMMGGVSCNALGRRGVVLPVSVADLCETCDALRVEVERLRAEVETWVKVAEAKNQQLDAYDEKAAQAEMVAIERSACQAAMQKMDDLRVVAEAALARAEAAELERNIADEALANWVRVARNTTAAHWQERAEAAEAKLAEVKDRRLCLYGHEATPARCFVCSVMDNEQCAGRVARKWVIEAEKAAEAREAGLRGVLAACMEHAGALLSEAERCERPLCLVGGLTVIHKTAQSALSAAPAKGEGK